MTDTGESESAIFSLPPFYTGRGRGWLFVGVSEIAEAAEPLTLPTRGEVRARGLGDWAALVETRASGRCEASAVPLAPQTPRPGFSFHGVPGDPHRV